WPTTSSTPSGSWDWSTCASAPTSQAPRRPWGCRTPRSTPSAPAGRTPTWARGPSRGGSGPSPTCPTSRRCCSGAATRRRTSPPSTAATSGGSCSRSSGPERRPQLRRPRRVEVLLGVHRHAVVTGGSLRRHLAVQYVTAHRLHVPFARVAVAAPAGRGHAQHVAFRKGVERGRVEGPLPTSAGVEYQHAGRGDPSALAAGEPYARVLVADGEARVREAASQHDGVAPHAQAAAEAPGPAGVRHHLVADDEERVLHLQGLYGQVAGVRHVGAADVQAVLAVARPQAAGAGLVVDERVPGAGVHAADDHQLGAGAARDDALGRRLGEGAPDAHV